MSSSSSQKKSTKQWFSKFRKCRAAKKRSFACSSVLRSTEGTCTMANQGKITRFVSVVSLGAEKNQVPILQASRTFSCVSSIFFHGLLSLRAIQIATTKTSTHQFPISLRPGVITEEHARETSKDDHSRFHAPLFACRHGRTYCLARADHWHSPASKMMTEILHHPQWTLNHSLFKLMNSTRLLTILKGGKDFFQQFKIQSSTSNDFSLVFAEVVGIDS